MDYTIFITTHGNSSHAEKAKNCIVGFNAVIFDGTGYPTYSKLINDCIVSSKTEIVIIMNHKIRATALNVYNMLHLIHKGYGLVCMRNFFFYGFKKDLIRKIGFFDERFIGGGCEDSDLIRRLIENNIGWYDSTETPLLIMKSGWDQTKAYEFFAKKWKNYGLERLLPDEEMKYDLGPYQGAAFLGLEHTILSKSNEDYFNSINFKFK